MAWRDAVLEIAAAHRLLKAGGRQRTDSTHVLAAARTMTFKARDEYIAMQAARQRQTTPEFLGLYALRGGVEATISQGVRAFDLRGPAISAMPRHTSSMSPRPSP